MNTAPVNTPSLKSESESSDETTRLEALEEYGVLGSPPDPAFEDISRLAAQVSNSPVAVIAFATPDHLHIHSAVGISPSAVPRGTVCFEKTLASNQIYEIPDARLDPACRPGIQFGGRQHRFFAGAPLITPSGAVIGCLGVFDSVSRRLSKSQLASLAALARQVIQQLELKARVREMDRAAAARQRVEAALTVERNFVSAVLDTVGALVAVYDTAGRIVRFNRACETTSGYEFPALVGGYAWDRIIPEQDVATARREFANLLAGHLPAAFENHWLHRDGSRRRIAWSATALSDHHGQPAFIITTGIDVTAQRAAEATLRESEARYRQLVEGSLGMVCTHDLHGVLLSVNSHAATSLGLTIDDMIGHPLTEFMPPEKTHLLAAYLHQLQLTGEAQGLLHLSHRNGEVRVVAYRNKLIDVPAREPFALGFGVDITEQVRAEDKLRVLIRQSNSILESIGDGIYGLDLEGRVTVINPAGARMLGYKPHEILGRDFHELIHHTRADGSPYPAAQSPILQTLVHRDTVRIANEVFWRKDGTSFPVEYVACPQIESPSGSSSDSPLDPTSDPAQIQIQFQPQFQIQSSRDTHPPPNPPPPARREPDPGRAVGVVVAFTDTTERRALDRMKDEFVSTVSHELRTPLTSLNAALGLIAGPALRNRPEKRQQMLDIAIANTERLVTLVNDILELERVNSGQADLRYTMCSVDDLLHRAATLQQPGAARAGIKLLFDAGSVSVWADPDRILQALTNLLSNAIKFSAPGSTIELTARTLDDSEAEICVIDHGSGIPEDKLEQIFDRFQQVDASDTRSIGGTGLGLAICRSIIQQHGGRIWATSSLGQGATIHFTLPTRPANNLR
jgi:two-component system sensor histidine kinase VicK